jgi:ATP-dependent helicase/nuclease subunit B
MFAACPYRYFTRYVLELEQRKEFRLEPLDVGTFYHQVLDALVRELNAREKELRTISDGELLNILGEQISKVINENTFISNFVRHSAHNAFIIHAASEVLKDFVPAMAQMVRAGRFDPKLSEAAFGKVADARETLGQYEIALSGDRMLSLAGKIDRLDVAGSKQEQRAIVFDYKRRGRGFNWSRFYHGLDIQLPIYMLAVRNTGAIEADIVGAFYVPIEVSPEKATIDELSEETQEFNYKARGIFDGRYAGWLDENASRDSVFYNFYVTRDGEPYGSYASRGVLKAEDFEKVLNQAERRIVELAESIISGRIDVKPFRLGTEIPCGYCDYKGVCRFDWQINDYNFLSSLSKPEVLERIGTVDG